MSVMGRLCNLLRNFICKKCNSVAQVAKSGLVLYKLPPLDNIA